MYYDAWHNAPDDAQFAVIGDPVKHSRSPRMHQAAYDELGLPYRYVALHVPVGEVHAALTHLVELGYQGVNVTVPHKEEALRWAAEAEPLAKKVRAVNTLRLRDGAGINTDAGGFIDTLYDRGVQPGKALLLGAGGSARALAYALAQEDWELLIYNRTQEKAERMVEDLGIEATVVAKPQPDGAHLIVNTTSASLQGQDIAVKWEDASPYALAYDLMYGDEPTRFLARARENNLRTCDGSALLVAQGARAFEWWLGVPAPREAMAAAIR
jgi:shikimate dehydrogenase